MAGNTILILDFGSQYTQLIARRIRELKVYSEILPFSAPLAEIRSRSPSALVLSGGPASVLEKDSPRPDPGVFDLGIPVLGICYGLQVMGLMLGGKVRRAARREYGYAEIRTRKRDPLFAGLGRAGKLQVWMSHGDMLASLPPGFRALGFTENSPFAAVADPGRRFYGVQFHPEVAHTPEGSRMLSNFLFRVCGAEADWDMGSFARSAVSEIRRTIGEDRVICALSGGVDSSVLSVLLHMAVGERLTCVFVDNGLLREGEPREVNGFFSAKLGASFKTVDASRMFLDGLHGVVDPERKRKIIGRLFIKVFERESSRLRGVSFLGQGTLYPDVIESVSLKGPSSTIKSHHNVGGLPSRMKLRLVEPLRFLFKDEVRRLGASLGLDERLIRRHPFPGPGLAVRILGAVTAERLAMVRKSDRIVVEEVEKAGLYDRIWQAFAVLLPVRSVGVMGDERTYQNVAAVRCITSVDGMTADWAALPDEVLRRISSRITSEVRGINRVVYDVSSKPPATIEWE